MALGRDPEKVLERFAHAESRKSLWEDTYEEAQTYGCPNRETFNEEEKGQRKDEANLIFDSTAQNAIMKFASNLQSSLVPPMKQWVTLEPGLAFQEEGGDNRNKEIKAALEKVTKVMFDVLQNSNFDTQVAESFLDLAVGTGALLVQEGTGDEIIRFTSVPLSQLYLEEGPLGRIETAFRKSKIAIMNIEKTWPDATIPEELMEKMEEDPYAEIEIIEATFPDEITVVNPDGSSEKTEGFVYQVICKDHKETAMVEREMRSSPWVVFRWSTLPGEIYGRGPLLSALADVKTLNKTKELLLKNASRAVVGIYTWADAGVMNVENIKIKAGSVIPVQSNAGGSRGPSLAPLPSSADFDVGQLVINDLRQTINEMLFADPLGPIDLPVKSATEISIRQQELAKRIGSAFGKLQFELLAPLINRILFILEEKELVDLGDFRSADGITLAINHVSPLAQAQEQETFMNMVRYAETLVGLFGPELGLGLMNPDVFSTKAAEFLNVPEGLTPDENQFELVKNFLAQRVAALAQQGAPQPAA